MPIDTRTLDAINLIASLRDGDPVTFTADGRSHDMTVSGSPRRCDGRYGSIESLRVTVTLGPGRWSTEAIAEHIGLGRQSLARRAPDTPSPATDTPR